MLWAMLAGAALGYCGTATYGTEDGKTEGGRTEGGLTGSYRPEGRDMVCIDGTHRFTRALYGSASDFRVETSDRPIFALFKKGACRNVRFELSCQGDKLWMDEALHCEARYQAGKRTYLLTDPRWGTARLHVTVMAHPQEETAVWRFQPEGFNGAVTVTCVVSKIRNEHLRRNGDLNGDPADSFESSGEETLRFTLPTDNLYAALSYQGDGEYTDQVSADRSSRQLYEEAERHHSWLSSLIIFDTPDPYLNALGGALTAAADGAWDGNTWQHGAVAWRMPLAGWRGGYLGDVMGWPERARSHFSSYAASQVRNVPPTLPHPAQDTAQGLSRAEKRWGTPMYSNGYIARYPGRSDVMHHYDMNLNFIDALLWHFEYDADTAYMREMWPVLTSHLSWEKRNFDPDDDGLYDAYCCIWASDALYYSGGAVTHSSAYNYRGNALAARIATLLGEDPTPFEREAAKTLQAMNERLWLDDEGHWAEYQDRMGLRRIHSDAALWSIYTPIDCGAATAAQSYRATRYIDRHIPHIPVVIEGVADTLHTLSTTDWQPYEWSINNVAGAEVAHTALAYFEAGRNEEGYRLLKANLLDFCYAGSSPGNFGQVSKYDKARGELYRDFTDHTAMAARALIQGLFGIIPDALNGRCILRPGLPDAWTEASIKTPYFTYRFHREGEEDIYKIEQHFARPLQIILRQNTGAGYVETASTRDERQTIRVKHHGRGKTDGINEKGKMAIVDGETKDIKDWGDGGTRLDDIGRGRLQTIDIDRYRNSRVSDIFKNEYRSPRPPYTTLQIPIHGIGDWCHPHATVHIDATALHQAAEKGILSTSIGIPFDIGTPEKDIVFVSLWDNYPDSIHIALNGSASHLYLLMAGSTNPMQSHIDNGVVTVNYADGTSDTLRLRNPHNWCPIEQDYYDDGLAFRAAWPRPYRIDFATGEMKRSLQPSGDSYGDRRFSKGAGVVLEMPTDPHKRLQSMTVRALSNDVVIGVMGVTMESPALPEGK